MLHISVSPDIRILNIQSVEPKYCQCCHHLVWEAGSTSLGRCSSKLSLLSLPPIPFWDHLHLHLLLWGPASFPGDSLNSQFSQKSNDQVQWEILSQKIKWKATHFQDPSLLQEVASLCLNKNLPTCLSNNKMEQQKQQPALNSRSTCKLAGTHSYTCTLYHTCKTSTHSYTHTLYHTCKHQHSLLYMYSIYHTCKHWHWLLHMYTIKHMKKKQLRQKRI